MSERIDHGQEARKHIGWAHDWQEREGDTEATGIATALIAQAEATLHQADATLALVEQLREQSDAVRAAVANHPDPCEKHPDGDAVSCGWKTAYKDVVRALEVGK